MAFRIYTRRKEGTSAVVLCLCFCVLLVRVQANREDHVDQHYPKCLTNKQDATQRRHHQFTLETSSRITHQLATHIFRILLEEEFGYAQVKIIYYDDYNAETITDRLNCYEGGGQGQMDQWTTIDPTTMINLEVPIPPDYTWLDKGCYKELGMISPPGHFGLFIPYVLVQDLKKYDTMWQGNSFDIHWTNFKSPTYAKTFDLKSEADLMKYINNNTRSKSQRYFCNDERCKAGWYIPDRCKDKPCAVILAPDFNSSNMLIDHINKMEVYVKVVWVGPNLKDVSKNLTDSLRQKRKLTFMIFSWTPSDTILNPMDFVVVSMGSCEVAKNGTTSGFGCFYGLRRSVKFVSEKVKDESSETYDLLKSMSLMENTIDEFGLLMELYRNLTAYNKSIPEIACEWIKSSSAWTLWSSTSTQGSKKKLYIGGIFPITGSTYTGRGIVKGATMAKNAINLNTTILSDYDLELLVADGQCRADKVMRAFIDYLMQPTYSSLVGVLGPACSDTVEPLAGLSKYYKTITISYSAEGAVFSDRDKYPYFLRTIGENTHYKYVYLELLKKLKWKRVAALTEDGQKYTEYISRMQNILEAHHITFISNTKFPRVKEREPMTKYLEDLKQKQARIIIADVFDEIARNVMCEAYRLKMTAKQGYVWFLPTWLNTTWYDTTYFNHHLNESVNCTTANMIEAVNGYFTITHAFYNDDDKIMQENITVGQWRQNYTNQDKGRNETSNYAGYAYDAVWTFALAVDKLIKEDPDAMYTLHNGNVTNKLTKIIKDSDFYGVSGHIKFGGGTTRFSVINVMQWHDNQSKIIGKFYPNISEHEPEIIGGTLNLNESAIVWLSGGRPDDGTLPQDECALNSLAKFLNVKCDMAIIILNLFIILLLLAFLGTVILVIKRRYDKKVMNTEQYMASLGLEHLLAPSDYTGLDKWEIARENVVLNRKLGEGAFGTVYGGEAKLPDSGWTPVAVKTLKIGSTPDEKLDFLSEAEVMKRFDHKNIVKLLGVCTKVEPVYTIMEFMLYGDLKTYLLARRHLVNGPNVDESEEVSSKKLTQMAIDVARGLSYLADIKYVHRDVASRNCLLNGQRVVKLGDFGMTRPTCDNDYYKFNRKGMLPVRWMAPESLALGVFTPSSDVWSFGVLLYEIITFGSFPFQGLSNFQVLEYVKAGNTITIPQGVKPATEFLLKTCWSSDPKLRPTASELVEYLANNSRIISPCLDLPLSSVQMEDTGQLEMQLPDQFRKCSSSLSFKNLPMANGISPMSVHSPTRRQQSIPCDSGVSIPLENCCPKEPLLPPRSDSISGCSKYVTLQHSDSGCEQEQDNYFPNSIINGHAVSKV